MGEGKRRLDQAPNLNGHNGHRPTRPTQIRLVPNIKIQNAEGQVMLMLGEAVPELGAALQPADARRLAAALLSHADELDAAAPRIILPGDPRL